MYYGVDRVCVCMLLRRGLHLPSSIYHCPPPWTVLTTTRRQGLTGCSHTTNLYDSKTEMPTLRDVQCWSYRHDSLTLLTSPHNMPRCERRSPGTKHHKPLLVHYIL